MDSSDDTRGFFTKLRTAVLILGGMILVIFGFTRVTRNDSGSNHYTSTLDGVAQADAPSSGDSGASGDSAGCGCGDSGGC